MDNVTVVDMQPVPFGLVLLKYLRTTRRVAPFFAWAERLGDEYEETSRWEGRALSNNGFYLVPNSRPTYGVSVAGNGYEGIMTAEAFGITLSLFALGQIANTTEDDGDILLYHALRDYALDHSESAEIMAAID
ncbi:antirestriction protein [Salmonella enterica subsp. enterica serovar Bijlmer]|nr:antirestriction protein [Salmonella enterica subsp. enterica serovar Bijlmer]ECB4197544.1 antirestriction protein [Salmonella enterica subsp. enterica serovar Bijlmer]